MSQQVGIVTDSVACIPREVSERLGIRIVPARLLVGSDDIVDGEITDDELHRRLMAGEVASTATPSPGEFLAAYGDLAAAGAQAVAVLTVSGALSNIANSARVAARSAALPVEVIDTRTVASAQGLIVRELAALASHGADLDTITEAVAFARERTALVAMVPDLRRLALTGRVPRVVASIGGRLDIKPLIRIGDDGEAHTAGLVRSAPAGIDRMLGKAHAGLPGGRGRAVVMHTLAAADARSMADELAAGGVRNVEVAPFTTVMGIHTGPGLLGVAWQAEK